jgi:hypothetical protein
MPHCSPYLEDTTLPYPHLVDATPPQDLQLATRAVAYATLPTARSGDTFGTGKMLVIRAVKSRANPPGQLVTREQTVGLDRLALAVKHTSLLWNRATDSFSAQEMALGSGSSLATDCSTRRTGLPVSLQLLRAGRASRPHQVSSSRPLAQSGRPSARWIKRSRLLWYRGSELVIHRLARSQRTPIRESIVRMV